MFDSFLKRLRGAGPSPVRFVTFRDSSGNFELCYPSGWRFDHDIMVADARYMVPFSSQDSRCTFNVAVDGNLPMGFNFGRYAKAELESPSSGIFAAISRGRFKGMPAYRREYAFTSGAMEYFGGGVMFSTGDVVFSISWSAPAKKRTEMEPVFRHMLKNFTVLEGFAIRRGKGKFASAVGIEGTG